MGPLLRKSGTKTQTGFIGIWSSMKSAGRAWFHRFIGDPDPNEQHPVVIVNRKTHEVSYTALYDGSNLLLSYTSDSDLIRLPGTDHVAQGQTLEALR